jgi:hypothetical protein
LLALPPGAAGKAVLVDNSDPGAANTVGCGVGATTPPCLTIGWGVARALNTDVVEVHVQGPGPYLGECFNSTRGIDERGIVIPNSASLAVVGLNASRGGAAMVVGAPVIDCEHAGRAFTYGNGAGPGDDDDAPEGARLLLEGLVVRNGRASGGGGGGGSSGGGAVWASGSLVLRRCAFEHCSSGGNGGAVSVLGAALVAADSNFTECETAGSSASFRGFGGGLSVSFGSPAENVFISITGCFFTNTKSGVNRYGGSNGWGGGASVFFKSDAKNVTSSFHGCSFVNTTSSNNGGGAFVSFSDAKNVTSSCHGCSFVNTTSSGRNGGGASGSFSNAKNVTSSFHGCSFVTRRAATSVSATVAAHPSPFPTPRT